MIDKIKNLADSILGVRQDLTDLANPTIENVVIGPMDNLRSFGPFPLNSSRLAKFILNDLSALQNKTKLELREICDAKILAVLFSMSEQNWFSRKDLLQYLEEKANDVIRDSE